MKKNRLSQITVKEISLVPMGANKGAKSVLFKSHKKPNDDIIKTSQKLIGENTMDPKELEAALAKSVEDLKKSTEEIAKLNTEIEDLKKKAAVKPAVDPEDLKDGGKDEDKELMKSLPEGLKKRFEELEKRDLEREKALKDSIEKSEKLEYTQKAEKEYPSLPGTPEEKGSFLKTVDKLPETEKEFALKLLKIADNNVSNAMKEIGKAGDADPAASTAEKKLDKMAKEYQTENKVSYENAYNEVMKTEDGHKLYDEYMKEKTK